MFFYCSEKNIIVCEKNRNLFDYYSKNPYLTHRSMYPKHGCILLLLLNLFVFCKIICT